MIIRASGIDYHIEPLNSQHDKASFSCGILALDSYLHRQARQDAQRKLSTVFVLTADGKTVAGFYTLSASSILAADLPEAEARKLPRFPLPVTLLGRMAVDQGLQGRGLGDLMLGHALKSALESSERVASWAVVVDAKDGALAFYLKRGFLPVRSSTTRLFLPLATIKGGEAAAF